MHILILADGDAPARAGLDAAWPGWDEAIAMVIAADGGARHADGLGVTLDRWVGDGDSIDPDELERLQRAGIAADRAPEEKDESDTELAITAAMSLGATRLTIVGALGGPRLDHALANLGLLLLPELISMDVQILDATARIRLLSATGSEGEVADCSLPGRIGDMVSLLPVGADAVGVSTRGLRYPLADETLRVGRTRGLSNVREQPVAEVALRAGRLLVVEAPATL
ncbi:MAG: thiamine diphosphokinase [Chloroflexota bacterium]